MATEFMRTHKDVWTTAQHVITGLWLQHLLRSHWRKEKPASDLLPRNFHIIDISFRHIEISPRHRGDVNVFCVCVVGLQLHGHKPNVTPSPTIPTCFLSCKYSPFYAEICTSVTCNSNISFFPTLHPCFVSRSKYNSTEKLIQN